MPAEYTTFHGLYDDFMFWSIVVGGFTFAWLTYTVLVHRKGLTSEKALEDITPGVFPKERDNLTLELAWFIVPSILVAWLVWLAWQSMVGSWGSIPDTNAEETFEMEIVGYQWFWEFSYSENLEWDSDGAAPPGSITFTNTTDGIQVGILGDVADTYGEMGNLVVVLSDLAANPYNLTSDGVLVGDIDAKGHPYRMGEHSVITVKVVVEDGLARCFTRQVPSEGVPMRHVGLYVFRKPFLSTYVALEPTPGEQGERLEQLRILEHGYSIAVAEVPVGRHGIDTPEQYQEFLDRHHGASSD